MSSFSEMPELVLENIICFSDFRSVLTLRQVCQDFRNFIDDLDDSKLPDSGFSKIELMVDEGISLTFEDLNDHEFIYSGEERFRSDDAKTTNLNNSNILDVVIRDLEQVLKFQKSELYLYKFNSTLGNDLLYSNMLVKLSNMFEKLNRKFKTKELLMSADSQSGFMSILPFADPQTLENLTLFSLVRNIEIEMDEIVKTEQWKNAKNIFCDFYTLNMKVEDMCDFSRVWMKMLSISARDLDFLKNTFITSTNFARYEIQLENFNENEGITDVWGPAFYFGTGRRRYFRINNPEEKVLHIEIDQKQHIYNRLLEYQQISIDIIQLNAVPNRAIVHDYNDN
ncbi:hypothetical protein L3Y34_009584 [Caenorhabditis briggsae]|uniref:F-box domain-containing protein n=1 Tax=Caenorhabditis briggsae TaxID=6238 RepID=A0AAE9A692_CAEBR|nr:hypothetical protein L3Y34_009584 [Caenorhabditis briggsae]